MYIREMDVHSHYKNHLSKFYTWMFGDYDQIVRQQKTFFEENGIIAKPGEVAVDLGCGSGFQSLALKSLGFEIYAVDLSEELLSELKSKDPTIHILTQDIRDLEFAKRLRPNLMICMGDTLTHLSTLEDVGQLIRDSYVALKEQGQLILTFRNLTSLPSEADRFFVVRSEAEQILTCFLEDAGEKVRVYDLLHRRIDGQWKLQKSYYYKLKVDPFWVRRQMLELGFKVTANKAANGMDILIGQK